MNTLRPAAVAGTFYPGQAEILAQTVRTLLADAAMPSALAPSSAAAIKAIIAPHAGYIYSGAVAANVYALLRDMRERVRRVLLLGPAHRVVLWGLATPDVEFFVSPLGKVPVDLAAIAAIDHLPQVMAVADAHAQEHSLEVHLPFLQTVFENFALVPLVVGDASAAEVAEVLELLWGGDETLIVISSDLSHYLPYSQAQTSDRQTAQAILDLRTDIDHHQACGATPINGLLLAAARHSLQPALIDLRNSGDTAGDKSRVVGYAAFTFSAARETRAGAASDATLGASLLHTARAAIDAQFNPDAATTVGRVLWAKPGILWTTRLLSDVARAVWLKPDLRPDLQSDLRDEMRASFVTLTLNGHLRGCIGSLEARRPLFEDVAQNAVAAAFHDPRFAPLTAAEWAQTKIEVSLLSPMQPMSFTNETDALAQLRPKVDGVVLIYRQQRATFLPQVWEQFADATRFIAALKQKAGLAADFWSDEIKLSRYTVTKWKEGA